MARAEGVTPAPHGTMGRERGERIQSVGACQTRATWGAALRQAERPRRPLDKLSRDAIGTYLTLDDREGFPAIWPAAPDQTRRACRETGMR